MIGFPESLLDLAHVQLFSETLLPDLPGIKAEKIPRCREKSTDSP